MSRSLRCATLLTGLLFGAGLAVLRAAPPTVPTEARLIDFHEQLGIDTPTPRFGWVVNDLDRGERQTVDPQEAAGGRIK